MLPNSPLSTLSTDPNLPILHHGVFLPSHRCFGIEKRNLTALAFDRCKASWSLEQSVLSFQSCSARDRVPSQPVETKNEIKR